MCVLQKHGRLANAVSDLAREVQADQQLAARIKAKYKIKNTVRHMSTQTRPVAAESQASGGFLQRHNSLQHYSVQMHLTSWPSFHAWICNTTVSKQLHTAHQTAALWLLPAVGGIQSQCPC